MAEEVEEDKGAGDEGVECDCEEAGEGAASLTAGCGLSVGCVWVDCVPTDSPFIYVDSVAGFLDISLMCLNRSPLDVFRRSTLRMPPDGLVLECERLLCSPDFRS